MSTIVHSRRGQPIATPVRGTEGPQPGFFETIGAGFRTAEDEQELTQAPRNAEAYQELLEALGELGVDTSQKGALYRDEASSIPGVLRRFRVIDRDAIYAEVLRQRGRDPSRFTELPATRDEYDQWIARRKSGRDKDQRTLERGGMVAALIGGVGSGMTDPYNIASMPAGAGQVSVLRTMLIEGLVGGTTEVANFGSTGRARERMGEDYTASDKAADVAVSAVASGVLGGAVRAAEVTAPKVTGAVGRTIDNSRAAMERMIADNWEKLPAAVRNRWAKGATIEDVDLPDLAEAIIGRGNMTKDQRAMVDAVRRDAEIDAINPFKPDMAGQSAHRTKLDDALAELLQPTTRQPRPFALPPRAIRDEGAPTGAAYYGSTGKSGRAALKSKIRGVESSGDDAARNPLSSATGRYQFTRGTWLRYYKRRFGSQGLTDDQIAAKRGDGRLQETLMDDLTADNAAFLRSIGEAESAGNLYLTHFAGTGGAKKLFAADPNARAADVLGADVARANPWMADYTAADVIQWAHRKMGEAAPRRAGSRAELADDGEYSRQLQAELDRLQAEEDAAQRARNESDGLDDAIARINSPWDDGAEPPDFTRLDDGADDIAPSPLRIDRASDGLSDREMALLPSVRAEVAGTAKLSDLDAMAKRLDATEEEVRHVMEKLAATERGLLVRRKDGSFRRAPSDKGPVDAFKFIARAGGMADNEGHDLGNIFSVQARGWGKEKGKGRRQAMLIPGAGPLVRQGGLSIDRVGELLHEAGYLRIDGDQRPTVADTLAYLEQGLMGKDGRQKLMPMGEPVGASDWVPPENFDDIRIHLSEWSHYNAPDLDGDDIEELTRLIARNGDLSEDAALDILTNRAIADALDDARFESGEYDETFAQYLDEYGADESGARFDADGRNAGEGGQGAAAGADEGFAEPIEYDGWDGDATTVADAQTASLIHDLDALAELSEGRFFYVDDAGEATSWAELRAELDQDALELQNMRNCL